MIGKQRNGLLEGVEKMNAIMHRAGPDDHGTWVSDRWTLALGHRRLSIIDLSDAGHQPMHDDAHGLTITYNGELYNYRALKAELTAAGLSFETQTDTEVILKAYAHWGQAAFGRFNGIFAFGLCDRKSGLLHLVRDHLGIKPLYYANTDEGFVFASEVRAFRAIEPNWAENPDWRVFFMAFGHLPEPVTTLQSVKPLQAGHCLTYDLGTSEQRIWKYVEHPDRKRITDEQTAVAAIRESLSAALERQLVSDAPIGLFLSGGVDSSVLTILAKPHLGERLHTSSLVFGKSEHSELRYQQQIIALTGARHSAHEMVQADFDSHLDDMLEAIDQPTNDGVNTYFVSKYARAAGLTVALSGLGADELLGGYPSFERVPYIRWMRRVPAVGLRALTVLLGQRFRKVLYFGWKTPVGDYLALRGIFTPDEIAQSLGKSTEEVVRTLQSLPVPEGAPSKIDEDYVSWLETNFYMRNQLLKDTDSMSMWHAMEIRVPFLDLEFIRTVQSIAPSIRFSRTQKKHLLIKAFPELPRAIWDRPKQGFTLPFERWFLDTELLLNRSATFEALYKRFQRGRLSWAKLWVGYLVECWVSIPLF